MRKLLWAILWTPLLLEAQSARWIDPPENPTYESLTRWHRENAASLEKRVWPMRQEIDLNGDGVNEVLLGHHPYGRGMVYVLFSRKGERWAVLCKEVHGSHNRAGLAADEVGGSGSGEWRSFFSFTNTGRGQLLRWIYRWDSDTKQYVAKERAEIDTGER